MTSRRAELAELREQVDADTLTWRRARSGRVRHKWLTRNDTLCGQHVIGGIDSDLLVFSGVPRCASCERFALKLRRERRARRRAGG